MQSFKQTTQSRLRQRALTREIARLFTPLAGAMLSSAICVPLALAGPQGGVVTAGQAQITQTPALTTITQATSRAAIDWTSFNVGAREAVSFQQPSSSAVTLNRVVGGGESAIFGRVQANGTILLINPDGIVFGRSAQVNVGGLVASTANVSNADFMAGRLAFTQPGKAGASVRNEGSITIADGGLAALVGSSVANSGIITARLGKVAMAAGDAFVLDLYGDKLVSFAVDAQAMAGLTDAQGTPLAARVDHSGQIVAGGGSVQLSAATVQRLVDNVINLSGTIRATSFESTPGKISLLGDSQTRLTLSGTLDASGNQGGDVAMTARDVALTRTARVLSTGEQGGGSIQVGGGARGQGDLAAASSVAIARGALLDASALQAGDGGQVIVWSSGQTRFAGAIRAAAGAAGGDGGQIEVSGAQLGFSGSVDAAAAYGRSGSLLLDPTDIVIDATVGDASFTSNSTADVYQVQAGAISSVLAGGTSVTLEATRDITLNSGAVIDGRLGSTATAGGGLSLTAGRDINLNGSVVLNAGAFTAAAGRNFTQTGGAASGNGVVASVGAGGALTIEAAGALTATHLLTAGAVTLTSTGGAVVVGQTVSGTTGTARVAALTVNGAGGVTLQQGALVAGATALTSSAGAVTTSGGTLDSTGAVSLTGATGVTTAAIVTPAAVTVTGTGAATAATLGAVSGPASGGTATTAASLVIQADGAVTSGGAVLGTGGLSVTGASGGTSSAGAFTLLGAGIVSGGAVVVNTSGDISLIDGANSPAGIQGASAGTAVALTSTAGQIVTLSAAGAAAGSGTGAVIAQSGNVTLDASSITLGSGGVQAVGSITMAGPTGITLGGDVQSTGSSVSLNAGSTAGAVQLAKNVNATSFTAGGASFTQTGTSIVTATGGGITITTAGAQSLVGLVASQAGSLVSLRSTSGAITAAQAVTGGSLAADGNGGVTLTGGALVTGTGSTIELTSAGTVTAGATLQAGGAVTLAGNTGVNTRDIVTPGAVSATSSAGSVVLGQVAGAADTTTASAAGLSVNAQQSVALAGAVLGSGGLAVAGATAGSAAASFMLNGSSILTTGPVRLSITDSIVLQGGAGIGTAGTAPSLIELTSSGGSITTGTGALLAAGPVTLTSGGSKAAGFGISVGSGGVQATGTLTLTAAGDIDTTAGTLGTLGSGGVTGNAVVVSSSAGNIRLGDVSTCDASCLAQPIGSGRVDVTATLGDVTLSKALGGLNTGYNYATNIAPYDGYRSGNRPAVGAVSITAGQDVELNGLNLDGDVTGAAPGLQVSAGRRLLSNEAVAVNRGDIQLSSGAGGGIFLGNSIYSRGIDAASAGGGALQKTAWALGIDAGAGSVYLFDNSDPSKDVAVVPDVTQVLPFGDPFALPVGTGTGGYYFGNRSIAQLTVSNNVANDSSSFVPLAAGSTAPKISITAASVMGYSATASGKLALADLAAGFTPVATELALNRLASQTVPQGIGLNVATFAGAQDQESVVSDLSNTSVYASSTIQSGVDAGKTIISIRPGADPTGQTGGNRRTPTITNFTSAVSNVKVLPSLDADLSPKTGKVALEPGDTSGSLRLFVNRADSNFGGVVGRDINFIYNLSGMLITLGPKIGATSERQYTAQLMYSGFTYLGPEGIPQGNLQQTAAAVAAGSALTAFGNVGGFGSNSGAAAGGNAGFGAGSAGTPTTPGPVAVAGATGFGGTLPSGAGDAGGGGAGTTPTDLQTLTDLATSGTLVAEAETGAGCDLVFGGSPAADADLGRGSPVSGAAQDVRRKRYLLARAGDASRTSQGNVESGGQGCGPGR